MAKVWEIVALGFGNVADYNQEIKSSHFDSDIKQGVGTLRHCNFNKNGYIKEGITHWADLSYFELSFTESSVPMAILKSRFSFKIKTIKLK